MEPDRLHDPSPHSLSGGEGNTVLRRPFLGVTR